MLRDWTDNSKSFSWSAYLSSSLKTVQVTRGSYLPRATFCFRFQMSCYSFCWTMLFCFCSFSKKKKKIFKKGEKENPFMIHSDIQFVLTVLKYLSVRNFETGKMKITKINLLKIVSEFLWKLSTYQDSYCRLVTI